MQNIDSTIQTIQESWVQRHPICSEVLISKSDYVSRISLGKTKNCCNLAREIIIMIMRFFSKWNWQFWKVGTINPS